MIEAITDIRSIFANAPIVRFRKHDVIIRSGEPISVVYLLVSGYVRLCLPLADGREISLHLYSSGDYLPTMYAFTDEENHYQIEAITAVETRVMNKDQFVAKIRSTPSLFNEILERSTYLVVRLLQHIEQMFVVKTDRKILIVLLNFLNMFQLDHGDGKAVRLPIPLTQTDLASWANASRETVSRQMTKFSSAKLVSRTGPWLTIKNIDRIRSMIENDE